MVDIIFGTSKKPISSQQLADVVSNIESMSGFLFIGFPVIGTPEGPFHIDALLISREKGIVVFDLVEGKDLGDFGGRADDCYNKVEAKFRQYSVLLEKRNLRFPLNVITFCPAIGRLPAQQEYILCNSSNLVEKIEEMAWPNPEVFENLLASIQSISTIRKGRKKRVILRADSRGAKLKKLEDSIANLDNMQSRAVIETAKGVQRIRGLAGSGKSIVLALKVAYFHAQHPEWKIAVTFNTRSLKGFFTSLINTFVIEQTNEEPDWENVKIIHAWGAPGLEAKNGIYFTYCKALGIEYLDFNDAKSVFVRGNEFAGVCKKAWNEAKGREKPLFDAILVDEAQDFSPYFLRICYDLLDENKRLVYAYDELQNLGSESLPSPEKLFGCDQSGQPRVKFQARSKTNPSQDIVLNKCYRNSRPVLVSAHALGFGIYRNPKVQGETPLVQIFENENLWLDIGYIEKEGHLREGSNVVLERTDETSPSFLEDHSMADDLIEFRCFSSTEEQSDWLVKSIQRALKHDDLRPDDVIVINPDPLSTRDVVSPIRDKLFQAGISSHLAGIDTSPDVFFQDPSITFTGIYRAKGNEAGMVYVLNGQDCFSGVGNLARIRNRLFTAITRSKAWVRVLGVGSGMQGLIEEFKRVKEKGFCLDFTYPTDVEKKRIRVVNRDMSETERKDVVEKQRGMDAVIDALASGKLRPEDIEEQIARMKEVLKKRKNV